MCFPPCKTSCTNQTGCIKCRMAIKKRIIQDDNLILYGHKRVAIVYSLTSDFDSDQRARGKKKPAAVSACGCYYTDQTWDFFPAFCQFHRRGWDGRLEGGHRSGNGDGHVASDLSGPISSQTPILFSHSISRPVTSLLQSVHCSASRPTSQSVSVSVHYICFTK